MNTAVKIPTGTPTRIAPNVTRKLPQIIGRIPKEGFELVGVHFVPKIKSFNPISLIAGIPFTNRNPQIKMIAATDIRAVRVKIPLATFSFPIFICRIPPVINSNP